MSQLNGKDEDVCGGTEHNPCGTIKHAIEKIAGDKAQIIIDGGHFSKESYTYYVNSTINIDKNIYIQGSSRTRKPILKSDPTGTTKYAFKFNADVNNEFLLKDLVFDNIGIAKVQNHVVLNLIDLEVRNREQIETDVICCIDHQQADIDVSIHSSVIFNYRYFLTMENFRSIRIQMDDVHIIGRMSNGRFIQNVFRLWSYEPDLLEISFIRCKFSNLASVLQIKIDILSFNTYYKKHVSNKFLVLNSTFQNEVEKDIETHPTTNSTIFIQGHIVIDIKNSHFLGGYGLQAGAIHLWRVTNKIDIDNTTFVNNTARWQGGACYFVDNRKISIKNSLFENNIALDDAVGNAGAIGNHGNLTVRHCTFINNTAQTLGGTIMHSPNLLDSNKRGVLELLDSTIIGSSKSSATMGGMIYSSSDMVVENMYFKVNHADSTGASLFHLDLTSIVKVKKNVSFHCLINQMLHIATQEVITNESNHHFRSWRYYCEFCPNQQYSVNHSYEHIITPSSNRTKNITCHRCPTGGTVQGKIISNDDFWGYSLGDGSVKFIPCPPSYCCSKFGKKCSNYNTCNHNRDGLLCGKCRKGYSENFISLQCIKDFNCSKLMFWTLFSVISVLYVLFIMYLKNIIIFFKKLANIVFAFDSIVTKEHTYAPIGSSDRDSEEERILTNSNRGVRNGENDGRISGLIKILFFFYQVEFTIRVKTSTKQSYDHSSFLKEMISSIFNINIASTKYWFLMCPYAGLTQLGKVGIKVFFIALLFGIVMTVYVISYLVNKYGKTKKYKGRTVEQFNSVDEEDIPIFSKPPFQLRLVCSLIQLLLLSYSTFARSSIAMINCVHINGALHLYIYGELQCYHWWQYVIFTVIAIWILPFSFTIYFSCKLLRSCRITLTQFFVILFFPPMLLVYYIKISLSKVKPHLTKRHAAYIKQTVMIFEEPFKHRYWESVLIFRRLTIILICFTISDPMLRLYVVMVPSLLFIVHHIYAWPYKHKVLNWLETVSLLLICLMAVINLFWSYIYVSNIPVTTLLSTIGQVFVIIENVILLLPVAAMIILLVLACGRRLYLLCVKWKVKDKE